MFTKKILLIDKRLGIRSGVSNFLCNFRVDNSFLSDGGSVDCSVRENEYCIEILVEDTAIWHKSG